MYQLVAETEAAWHAGDAIWQGETAVNECSIGIELVNSTGMTGFKGQDPYPDVQVQKLDYLARNLMQRYPNIAFARHLDVAIPKGRKTDPKGFDWTSFRARLATPPPPSTKRYRVRGLAVYEASTRQGKLWGHLRQDEIIEIDDPKTGHLKDARGFIRFDPDTLEAIP